MWSEAPKSRYDADGEVKKLCVWKKQETASGDVARSRAWYVGSAKRDSDKERGDPAQ